LFKVVDKYVDPRTKETLINGEKGNLYKPGAPQCIAYENQDGIYDFIAGRDDSKEREHYDAKYKRDWFKPLSVEDCRMVWHTWPGFEELHVSMGDISGKKILLLGNGTSAKEFYFLHQGAKCVYTDLSVEAVKYMKAMFGESEFKHSGFDNIEFHAVDGCQMPFPDESFDIVYGCSFVHHIEDIDRLFSEVARCLKPGGICRFLDHAYSPLWQRIKNTVLKPVQLYTHRKHGISPADVAATKKGGYKHEELKRIEEAYGFTDMLYLRVAFFEHLLQRGTSKLGGRCLRRLKPLTRVLDTFLDKVVSLVQKHGIVLVWGFTK